MKNKEKAVVYPYNIEFSSVVRHRDLLQNYNIVSLIAPSGFGFTGKDGSVADKGTNVGINVESDFSKAIDICDTVIIADCNVEINYKAVIVNKMLEAINKKKNIVCTIPLGNEQKEMFVNLSTQQNVYFKYCESSSLSDFNYNENILESIDELGTPIILVAGLSERTNKFEIQLSIRQHFIKSGYKCSQIGSRSYCELFGFHSFPKFMYDYGISESKRIVLFNKYVKYIEETEQPDLIIIGIPGGIMPMNHMFTCGFGVLAYQISQAIMPDIAVISVLYEDYFLEYYEKLNTTIKYKFGFNVDYFNLSNNQFDWGMSKVQLKKNFCVLDSEFVSKKIAEYSCKDFNIYNIYNPANRFHMLNHMESVLSYYGERSIVSDGGII